MNEITAKKAVSGARGLQMLFNALVLPVLLMIRLSSPLTAAKNKLIDQLGREIVYQPQRGFQVEVHRRLEDIVTIGGSKFPGKTQCMIGESMREVDHPQYHGIFFRRVHPSLQEIVDRCHEIFPKLGAHWSGDLHRYTFPSRAKVDFSHLQHEEDKRKHQGKQYSRQFWDQLEEFTATQFDYVVMQNRAGGAGLRCGIMGSHNPGGASWVKHRFVDGKKPGKTYYLDIPLPGGRTARRTTVFIRGSIQDNKIGLENNPTYLANLLALPPKMRKAYLDGDYEALEGQYFEEWSSSWHVIAPFEIPMEWRIYMSMDWGHAAPLAVYWWAVEPGMKHVYCIREYYLRPKAHKKDSASCARELNEINKEVFGENYVSARRIEMMYADPSIFSEDAGKPIVDYFTSNLRDESGRPLLILAANNERVAGWNVFHNMLKVQKDGRPFCMWFSTCRNAIETIPSLVHDETRPEDVDTDGDDHAADSSRYFFVERFAANPVAKRQAHDELKEKDPGSYQVWEQLRQQQEARSSLSATSEIDEAGT